MKNHKDIYKEKADILIGFFGIYGYGHFTISTEETAKIIQILCEKNGKILAENIEETYKSLEKKYL